MYEFQAKHQISITDFNQSCGMQLDESNEWISIANRILGEAISFDSYNETMIFRDVIERYHERAGH